MKPYFIYGSLTALINAGATLVIYLAGLHSDPSKLSLAGNISLIVGLITGISFMVAGVRSKRNLTPPTENFTFGMALGVAIVVGLVATVLSTAFQVIYQSFINTAYTETVIQAQVAALQAKNFPAEQIEKAEGMIRLMMKPGIQAAIGLIFGTVLNVILALIIAAVMKRKATETYSPSPATS